MSFSPPKNHHSLFVICFICLTEDVSVGGFEGSFLSWWEWLQKMFYSSPEDIFTAEWRFESEWRFVLRFWTDVSRGFCCMWILDSAILYLLHWQQRKLFHFQQDTANSRAVTLSCFKFSPGKLNIWVFVKCPLSTPFHPSCTTLCILLYICVVSPLMKPTSLY